MSEHTPGPWLYRSVKYDDWGIVRAFNECIIAKARAGRWDIDEDAHRKAGTDPYEANARLIAAAPELYYAMKIYFHAHKTGNSVPPKIVEEARAAIAKAEGCS